MTCPHPDTFCEDCIDYAICAKGAHHAVAQAKDTPDCASCPYLRIISDVVRAAQGMEEGGHSEHA